MGATFRPDAKTEPGNRRAQQDIQRQLTAGNGVTIPASADAAGATPTKAEFDALRAETQALRQIIEAMRSS